MHYKRLIIMIALACCFLPGMSQKQFNAKAFDSELLSYVTRQASLTREEYKRFAPIYREMLTKKRDLHCELRQLKQQQTTNERVAKSLINRCDNLEVRMKQVEKSYHQQMLKAVSALKLKAIIDAERLYHRSAFRKAAKCVR